MAYISRDPFARTETHRRGIVWGVANPNAPTCDWCGSRGRLSRSGATYTLYIYRTEHDAGRSAEHKGKFCSKSCHDSYHG